MTKKDPVQKEEAPGTLSREEADALVLEHKGWCESIARAVARAWNLDWRLDGIDGAALEALIFCSRRFQPDRGVPFKGYSRKRIHEASTDSARKSRGWTRGSGSVTRTERLAREVSVELFNVFPELRGGQLPSMDGEDSGPSGMRIAIQQLLVGATIIAARQGLANAQPDEMMDFKRMLICMKPLEPVHQVLLWKIYWEGHSLRGVADAWNTDELNVIREHKVLLEYLQKALAKGKSVPPPRVRPGLKDITKTLDPEQLKGIFSQIGNEESAHE